MDDDINFEGKHIGYNTLLRKCMCPNCMAEKKLLEGLNDYGLREK